ncbi:S-layer homology domain-containing protein [Paenibacillus polygoni]|uniref:S-layer homology domain-containing protein n=1 Tax=Paenibacillus polygoni TaxID=3050112 RepID=A0ABY8X797_9BACL|nr:S-layer homology domain-containing protein [Paenibacillus polygoni]WIV21320.1 S-layer homology domain-containing protein [Paenibacillus polygoni]
MFNMFKKGTAFMLSFILVLSLVTIPSALPASAESLEQAGSLQNEHISKVTTTFYGDTTSSKGFTWYTSKQLTDSTVQVIKKTGAEPDFDKALTFTGTSTESTNSQEELVHKAEASKLEANTKYYYRVGDKKQGIWSKTGIFQTAPQSGAFTFIDIADTQAKTEEEAILSAETLEKALQTVTDAQFVVHNGDIVDKGTKEEQWDWLLGHSQDSLLQTTIVPSAGNHEDENYAFYEHFHINEPDGSATETGAYYSFDYSNAHFIVLNSNEDSAEYANFSKEQVEWLKKDAAAAKKAGARWIIVNIHKGPYTTSNHATDEDIMGANGVRNQIAPLMAELDIDFVMQGHDHIYARTKPITSEGKATSPEKITETLNGETIEYSVNPDGSIYMIPATAGPKVYYKNKSEELGDSYYRLFEKAEEHHAAIYGPDPDKNDRPKRSQVQNFVGIKVDGDKLTAVTYEIDQNKNEAKPFIVDQFGIIKNDSAASTKPVVSLKDISGHWAESAIQSGVTVGYIKGYQDETFKPNAHINRAEFITMLGRALQMKETTSSLSFTDAKQIPSWASPYISQAVEAGIVDGYTDGTFRASKQLNRSEITTWMVRAAGLTVNNNASLSFTDKDSVPAWAVPYVAAGVKAGLISGVGQNRFAPKQLTTRAEAAVFIAKLLKVMN